MAAEKAALNAPEASSETAKRAFAAWQKGEHDGQYNDFLALMSAREDFVLYSHPLEKRGVLRGGAGGRAARTDCRTNEKPEPTDVFRTRNSMKTALRSPFSSTRTVTRQAAPRHTMATTRFSSR